MTRVVISQPMYFPWAGFMAQMSMADVFIWLDDVPLGNRSFTNRIQVKTATGRKWMTIPLVGGGRVAGAPEGRDGAPATSSQGQRIIDLQAVGDDWKRSHHDMLARSFAGQPFRSEALEIYDQSVAEEVSLCHMLINGAEAQAAALNILPSRIMRSSGMAVGGSSSDRIFNLVQAVGGTDYITGHGALAYLDHEGFEAAGIGVSYMDYHPDPWPQGHGEFTPYVTGLDLLAACAPSDAVTHLRPASVDWRSFRARQTA